MGRDTVDEIGSVAGGLPGLGLDRWSSRFDEPDVERAFESWFWTQTPEQLLAGLVAAIVLWGAVCVVTFLFYTERALGVWWAYGAVFCSFGVGLWLVLRRRTDRFPHVVAERSRQLGVALAMSDAALDVRRLTEGERFAGRYRIVSALGAGAMGVVYEVERTTDRQETGARSDFYVF